MTHLLGSANPNWKGGHLSKQCEVCGAAFPVRPGRPDAKYCSMKCVGASQRGRRRPPRAQVTKSCAVCSAPFSLPRAHADRSECCSKRCAGTLRSQRLSGEGNHNWRGGISRLPYPWNFRFISRRIIERDGGKCQGPECAGRDPRLTTHHIDYDKSNCADGNLIALCSACNSKANFDRPRWQAIYTEAITKKGGNWQREEF